MINVGIIGAGHGVRALAPAIAMIPDVRVSALAARTSVSLDDARGMLDVPTFSTDWRTLVDDPGIDALAIAVPPAAQPEIALAGMDAGKTLFLEKPLSLNLSDAIALSDRAEETGTAAAVDFIFPMLEPWQALRKVIGANTLGPIIDVNVDWRTMTYANRHKLESWKTRTDDGGGTLLNFASHTFHYLDWLFGDIASIQCSLSKSDDDPRDGDTRVAAELFIADKVPVHVNIDAGYEGAPYHRVVVQGRDGTLVLENTTRDYVKGFTLRRDDGLTEPVVDSAIEAFDGDGRILATSRIFGTLFKTSAPPAGLGVPDALKTQRYLSAAHVSAKTGKLCVAGQDF